MYSKFFQHSDIDILQKQVDTFLGELADVTGQVTNINMLHHNNEIIVMIIYSCWKRI